MKKTIILFICMIITLTSIIFVGCLKSGSSTKAPNSTKKTTISNSPKIFTLEELKKYNGKNGNPAYVAVKGIVYDVTNAENWKDGVHKNGITAGKDLTEELKQSPHGNKVLNNLPVVGKLQQ